MQNRKRLRDLREWTYGCQGKGIVRTFGMGMYTLLYLKWITSKDLLWSTWNSAQCHVAACLGGGFGEEPIHVYVWLSPFTAHLKLTQHCQLAITQYKIKSFFLKSPLTLETQTASVYTGTCTLPLRSLQQTLKEMHDPETRVQNNQCSFIVIFYLRGSTQTVFCGEAVKCAISILPSSWLSWHLQPNNHTAGSWQICRSGRGWGGWAGEGSRERGSGCSPLASSLPLQFTLPGRFLSWIHWLP